MTRLDSTELARIYSIISSTNPDLPLFPPEMLACLKAIAGHLLADELEAEEFSKALDATPITIGEPGDEH